MFAAHSGNVIRGLTDFHADGTYVYQQEPQGIMRHPFHAFSSIPEYGRPVCITYEEGRAVAIDAPLELSRKLKH